MYFFDPALASVRHQSSPTLREPESAKHLLFTSGFSQVTNSSIMNGNRLNGFRLTRYRVTTWLKPGVNETKGNELSEPADASLTPESKQFRAVEQNRHRPVVYQLDLHHRLKPTRGDVNDR